MKIKLFKSAIIPIFSAGFSILTAGTGCRTHEPAITPAIMPPSVKYSPGYQGEIEAEYHARSKVGFCCNYWHDINNNGNADFPEEYAGIKNKFRSDEKLTLIFITNDTGLQGRECKVNIIGPNGNSIDQAVQHIPSDNVMIQTAGRSDISVSNWLLSLGGAGLYKATWFTGNDIQGYTEFEILGNPGKTFPETQVYTVKKGDTLSKIALNFKLSTSELARANRISNPNKIFAGQKLQIPRH